MPVAVNISVALPLTYMSACPWHLHLAIVLAAIQEDELLGRIAPDLARTSETSICLFREDYGKLPRSR
jgi:hypothetical protein